MFFDEGITSFLLSWVKGIHLGDFGNEGILEFNGVVEWTMWGKDIISLFREDVSEGRAKAGDRDVLGFLCLGELSRDGDLVDLFVLPSCCKVILTERPVIFDRRGCLCYQQR